MIDVAHSPASLATLLQGLMFECSSLYFRGRRHEPFTDPNLPHLLSTLATFPGLHALAFDMLVFSNKRPQHITYDTVLAGFAAADSAARLEHLEISHSELQHLPAQIPNLRHLRSLDISGVKVVFLHQTWFIPVELRIQGSVVRHLNRDMYILQECGCAFQLVCRRR